MPENLRRVEALLQTKFGFSPAKSHSSAHRWYELHLPGLPPIRTFFSHGKKRSADLESKIARQLRVRRDYFKGMIDCTNSREDYYNQVRQSPYPPFEHRY